MKGAACAALAVLSLAGSAGAAKLYAANDGVDGDACGAKSSPCRSISRAIARAEAGDTIVVGPGRYGELTGDADFDDPGEEAGAAAGMIVVDKRVRIESVAGATATVIHGGGLVDHAVSVAADGVSLGASHKGFTVAGGILAGIRIETGVSGVTLRGNLAVGNGTGFLLHGSGHSLSGNVAVANGAGFDGDASRSTLRQNFAVANESQGIRLFGDANVIDRNTATANGLTGLDFQANVAGGGDIKGNAAIGNGAFGASFGAGDLLVRDLSAIGNQTQGITASSASIEIQGGNAYGNRECGLFNASVGAIAAPKVYWGSPAGPGDVDPADPLCDLMTPMTTGAPFATKPAKLKTKSPF